VTAGKRKAVWSGLFNGMQTHSGPRFLTSEPCR